MRRRDFLATTAMWAAAPVPALRTASYGTEMPDMLLEYLGSRLNAHAARWDAERARIRTAPQIEERNRFVRDRVREMIHGLPEKTPLNPVVVRTHERDGYRIENVTFESRPGFRVTANLYVPTGSRGPFPGVISPCGHSAPGRMQPNYQFAYLDMVKSGMVVLAFDPVGQGERRQYWNPETGATESGLGPVFEHSMPGQLLLLLGEDLTQYRVWDGMRAIDYLLTRPEVDPQRIACAGHSGGGTLTMFISAIDERVRCAVVSEGGTSHRWPARIRPGMPVGPADVEQNLFPAALYGVDNCDLHVAIAPRPLLALIEEYSPRFLETAEHIRMRYEQLGAADRFKTEEAADPHGWTVKLRLATTDWLCRWLLAHPGPAREPHFEPEPAEKHYCVPKGSIRYSGSGETIFTLIRKKQAALPPARREPPDAAAIRKALRYRRVEEPLAVRRLGTTPRKGYEVEKLEFLSEPGIYIPAWVFVPERREPGSAPILFLDEAGKEAEGLEFGLLESLARRGRLSVAVDVRGIGGTAPSHGASTHGSAQFAHLFNTETAMAYMAWFMDESLFGMRVQDVVHTVDYIAGRPERGATGVHAIGRGMGALWLLYAAALDSRIEAAVCERGLVSYRALTESDRYLHGANVFLPGVLREFDLGHVAAAVAGRTLVLLSPVDAMKRPAPLDAVRQAYAPAAEAYAARNASTRFRIETRAAAPDAAELYLDLLRQG